MFLCDLVLYKLKNIIKIYKQYSYKNYQLLPY